MEKDLANFPLLFDRIGSFLIHFNALREMRLELGPGAFVEEFDKFVKGNSPSGAEEALAAFKEILDTVYAASARGCPTASTRMPKA
jgi:hypothetical protein